MSLNHLSPHLPETLWWAHHYHNMETSPSAITSSSQPNSAAFWGNPSALKLDLNNDDEEDGIVIEDERENGSISMTKQGGGKEMQVVVAKELLFEKPLTPSDVGKLNRLVIPKQHAEKYFPLNGNDSGVEKGLLLSFEDESGKAWRFRYSYWNSSQSYVLTKGWSRFVKEKRLDAGDSVLFERHRLDGDRLFIGWRRRRVVAAAPGPEGQETGVVQGQGQAVVGGWTQVYFPGGRHPYPPPHDNHRHHWPPAPLPCQPDSVNAAGAAAASELQNQTRSASANYKRLRLFGVNLECQQQPDDQYSESSSEPPTPPEGSSTWTQGQAQALYQFQYFPTVHHAYFNPHTLHQDINFSREMNQSRYNQG